MSRLSHLLAIGLLFFSAALPMQAQEFRRSNPQLLAAMSEISTKASAFTVRVRGNDRDVALGTIVKPDGWVLTKASELKRENSCVLKDGRALQAKIVGVWKDYDLAMLKIDASDLPAADWRPSTEDEVGSWVITPGLAKEPLAVGVLSVAKRVMPARPNPTLGLVMHSVEDGVRVSTVRDGMPAQKAGIKENDVVVGINDVDVADSQSLLEAVANAKTGDQIKIRVLRGGERMELAATLRGLANTRSGFLGVQMEAAGNGVLVTFVVPGSAAEKAGIKSNDLIVSINDQVVSDNDAMMDLLAKTKPGDEITVHLIRDGEKKDLKAKLGRRQANDRGAFQNSMGNPMSERRDGFPIFFQHDTVLKPNDCGGPAVDIDGKVIGINIARAGRTESYAIPSEVVQTLLPKLMSGKLVPVAAARKLAPIDRLKAAEVARDKALAAKKKLTGAAEDGKKAMADVDKQLAEAEEAIKKAKAEVEADNKKDEEKKKSEPKPEKK